MPASIAKSNQVAAWANDTGRPLFYPQWLKGFACSEKSKA